MGKKNLKLNQEINGDCYSRTTRAKLFYLEINKICK